MKTKTIISVGTYVDPSRERSPKRSLSRTLFFMLFREVESPVSDVWMLCNDINPGFWSNLMSFIAKFCDESQYLDTMTDNMAKKQYIVVSISNDTTKKCFSVWKHYHIKYELQAGYVLWLWRYPILGIGKHLISWPWFYTWFETSHLTIYFYFPSFVSWIGFRNTQGFFYKIIPKQSLAKNSYHN